MVAYYLFAMAGLWETWKSPDGQSIHSCTVITTKPNSLVKDIHDRMPVILKPEDEKVWLDTTIDNTTYLNDLLKPLSEDLMEAYEVSSLVNSPKNNSPNLIQKICKRDNLPSNFFVKLATGKNTI